MKNSLLAVTVLTLCSVGFAQVPRLPRAARQSNQQQQAAALQAKKDAVSRMSVHPDSADCSFTFASGTNNTFISYCVSQTGNLVSLSTPQGHSQVSFDGFEGYGICDFNSGVAYSDFGGAGDSGNWLAPTLVSRSGTAVKIARTTSDGIWTLTQAISLLSGAQPQAKIAMTLKNNTAVAREAFLMRYADIDADGVVTNNFDATFNTAMGYNSIDGNGGSGAPFGLTLQNVGNTNFGFDAFAQNTFEPPAPCNPFVNIAGPFVGDGSIVQLYGLELSPKSAGTVTVGYRGM